MHLNSQYSHYIFIMFFSLKAKNKIITLLSITIFLFSFFVSWAVKADNFGISDTLNVKTADDKPLSDTLKPTDLSAQAGTLIGAALSFIGIIFLILIIYGGFQWMTAGGNEEQVTKAKVLIISAVVGLMIIASAYLATKFIGETLIE